MYPVIEIAGARVFLGDCRDVLRSLPDNSVDSVVTDPPYELGFMGKKWDSSGIAYDVGVWAECLRVLKPGGHVLAFGGSRTWHRLAVAVEDAGFEIRDNIAWIYGSGFPKSLDVSKAIDKRAGAEREILRAKSYEMTDGGGYSGNLNTNKPRSLSSEISAPATSEAKQWEGWGTALKPAHEPVVVGRKPLAGTVAENVLEWGVGGLNIDGSRVGTTVETWPSSRSYGNLSDIAMTGGKAERAQKTGNAPAGRWPANVILDEHTAGLLDEQSGENPYRFFYQAKASKRDRNEGLEELEATSAGEMVDREEGSAGMNSPRAGAGRTSGAKNFHPTVKPTQLMRYLIKLVTPPGGTVLDPFTGSGSTGKAALLDGFGFVGAELTEEYLPIIEGRLKWAIEQEGKKDDTFF